MKNYIYYYGESFEISDKAKKLIDGLQKDYKVVVHPDDNSDGDKAEITYLTLNVEKDEKKYRLRVYDLLEEDTLVLRNCTAIYLEEKFRNEENLVFSNILNNGFLVETYDGENDEPCDKIIVEDLFPEYLKNNFDFLEWRK